MDRVQVLRKFVAPEFIFGPGCRHLAGRYARNFGGRKVLVVSDKGVEAAGWTGDITRSLEQTGMPYALHTKISPNPRVEEVAEGAEVFLQQNCNLIIAVGGGSPMDCAKGIGIMAVHRRNILEFVGIDRVTQAIPPLICVPTTGGTGADLSQFSILSHQAEKVKVAIISKAVVPDVSLVDPETLTSMSPYLTACTALDALTHAIEAFVSSAHSPMTDLHALEAIRLISSHLVESVNHPKDVEVRANIMLGSLNAGLAFSNAILGATHAMAHSLGGYLDLAHGECKALLVDRVIDFNFPMETKRFEKIGQVMGIDFRGRSTRQKRAALINRVAELKQACGLHRRLGGLGVGVSDIPYLSRQAMKDPCLVTNPRRAAQRDIEVLYEEAL